MKSIEINYLGDNGYEVLYPNTTLNSVVDWQESLYSKDEILDSATKALYGLGEDSVPKDVLNLLTKAVIVNNGEFSDLNGNSVGVRVVTGTYVGTGSNGASNLNVLNLGIKPKVLLVEPQNDTSVTRFHYFVAIYSQQRAWVDYSVGNSTGDHGVTLGWDNTWASWYNQTSAERQLNLSNVTYQYVAIG